VSLVSQSTFSLYNNKVDIYAMGIVVCELATNFRPSELGLVPPSPSTVPAPPEGQARWAGLSQQLRDFILLLIHSV
jgi:serine/threonine protein kinase